MRLAEAAIAMRRVIQLAHKLRGQDHEAVAGHQQFTPHLLMPVSVAGFTENRPIQFCIGGATDAERVS